MRSYGTDLSTAVWRRSSYSNQDGGDCVEVADGCPGVLPVRDSKNPGGPILRFGHPEWASFVARIRAGRL
ncbi:DUF397 domain-containing protein [Streptomyces xiamenensis]|uniref:DUF397 domain-containing protein n=1 Tax=Streptomyces TaxID=1883 RepID=UPI000997C152|nr:DUF397 domain-containing protein [Streptomyces sp. NRRL F-2890]